MNNATYNRIAAQIRRESADREEYDERMDRLQAYAEDQNDDRWIDGEEQDYHGE